MLLQVVREETETGRFEFVSGRPALSALSDAIRGYVGYEENSFAPVRRREPPTGGVSLILSFGPRINVYDSAADSWSEATSFFAGTGESWALTEYSGAQHGLQVNLTPPAASMILGVPLDRLSGAVFDLNRVLGPSCSLLIEQLAELPTWPDRFDLLDSVLESRLASARTPAPAATWAWQQLMRTDGQIPIGTLVDELGCSHRYLLAEFRAQVGVTPKQFARVLRCQRAIRHLTRLGPSARLTEVALDCGYFDAAHFSREFRRIVGIAPSLWTPAMASLDDRP